MLSRHALNVSWVILLSTQCNGVVFAFFYYDYFQKKIVLTSYCSTTDFNSICWYHDLKKKKSSTSVLADASNHCMLLIIVNVFMYKKTSAIMFTVFASSYSVQLLNSTMWWLFAFCNGFFYFFLFSGLRQLIIRSNGAKKFMFLNALHL